MRNETSRFKIFVENSVRNTQVLSEILKLSSVSQWRYVHTSNNPADLASRGAKVESFLKTDAWIHGPDFILNSEENWPTNPVFIGDSLESPMKMETPLETRRSKL